MAFRNRTEDRREQNGVVYYIRADAYVGGIKYGRMAIQTHFVERGESYIELVSKYVSPIAEPGDILSISEKVITMCQNNVVEKKDVTVGFWARTLSRFATSNTHGIAMDEPYKLQLAINLAGLPRILLASFCAAVARLFGKRGVFYKIAGHGIAGIDGFYSGSSFPTYHDIALLNPKDPDGVCREIETQLGISCLIVDANDFGIAVFGKSPLLELPDETLQAMLKDNPSGQSDEMTPLILIRAK